MRKTNRFLALLLAAALFLTLPALAYAVIEPSDDFYIADYSQDAVISQATRDYIKTANKALETQTGAQIVVAVTDFIDGADIEDYARTVFNEWEIGDAELNNGLLILLVLGEQNYWGMTGTGLSSALSASLVAEYMNDYLEPDFAAARYDAGVRAVFDAFLGWFEVFYDVTVAKPEAPSPSPTPEAVQPSQAPAESSASPLTVDEQVEAIKAKGAVIGKIAKWFLIGLALLAFLIFLAIVIPRWRYLRRRGYSVNILNHSFWNRRNHPPRPMQPPMPPPGFNARPGGYNSRPVKPNGFNSRPAGFGNVNQSPQNRSGGMPPRGGGGSTRGGGAGRGSRPSGFGARPSAGFGSRPSGFSSRPSRPSGPRGGGGRTRGGGAGRRP